MNIEPRLGAVEWGKDEETEGQVRGFAAIGIVE
jgi:hypothetical protein